MRETGFIKQNKEKWKEFEKILEHKDKDPDKLNNLFIQITDDLSYSRTFYPNRSVRVYLNNLGQQVFHSIYKNRKTRWGRLIYFWTDELPQLVYNARKEFLLSLMIFVISMAIGMLSSAMEPDFLRVILGDNYVDMTIANIESGDPMAVYKQRGELGMTLGITANNLWVAFFTFVLGVFFGVGSGAIMITNGIMLGAFQYFFIEKGLFWESFLTVWIHGTLEISAIIIAGAAGMTMGKGLVFPGTLTRIQSFQISARRGIKLMMGVAPIIVIAGIIESYLTRYTETPDLIRGLFILASLIFVLGYFVLYPKLKAMQGFKKKVNDTKLPPDADQAIAFDRIKDSGEIFSDLFIFFRKSFREICFAGLGAGLIFCLFVFSTATKQGTELFAHPRHLFGAIGVMDQYFINGGVVFMPVINVIIYTLSALFFINLLIYEVDEESRGEKWTIHIINFFKLIPPVLIIQLIMMSGSWYSPFLFIVAIPIMFLWMFVSVWENTGMFQSLSRTFSLISGNFGRMLGLFVILFLIGLLFYNFMDSGLLWFYLDVIGWNFAFDEEGMNWLLSIMVAFSSVFFINLIFSIMIIGIGIQYFTLWEIEDAPSLKEKIKFIGSGRRIHGMEKES